MLTNRALKREREMNSELGKAEKIKTEKCNHLVGGWKMQGEDINEN